MSDDLSGRRTRVEHERMTKSFINVFGFVEEMRAGYQRSLLAAISCETAERPHSLLFPVADGDDALAFAIPLQVIAENKCQHAS